MRASDPVPKIVGEATLTAEQAIVFEAA